MKYLILLMVFLGATFLLIPNVLAEEFNAFPECSNPETQNSTVCEEAQKPQDPDGTNSIYGKGSVLAKATSLIAIITGIASVIAIIIGGLKFVLSGGDGKKSDGKPGGVESARNTIIYALIGLGLALFAQAIVVFVINKL